MAVFGVAAVGAGWALTLLLLAVAPEQQASLLVHVLLVYPISYAPAAAALLALRLEGDPAARAAFWGRLRAWRRPRRPHRRCHSRWRTDRRQGRVRRGHRDRPSESASSGPALRG